MYEYIHMYIYIYDFLELPEFYDYSVYCAQHEQFSDRKLAEKSCIRQFCQGYSISIQLNNEDCQSIKRLTRTSHFFTVMSFSRRWIWWISTFCFMYMKPVPDVISGFVCTYILFFLVDYFICPYSCKPGILFHLALWIFYHFRTQF